MWSHTMPAPVLPAPWGAGVGRERASVSDGAVPSLLVGFMGHAEGQLECITLILCRCQLSGLCTVSIVTSSSVGRIFGGHSLRHCCVTRLAGRACLVFL
jgi:hypothetical protein